MTDVERWARRQNRVEMLLLFALCAWAAALFVFGPMILIAVLRWWPW